MNQFKTPQIRLVWMSILIIVGIIACNIPVKYSETVGNILSWTILDTNGTAEEQVHALPWIQSADLSVKIEQINQTTLKTFQAILRSITEAELEGILADITSLDGYQNYQLTPIEDHYTVPAYRAVLHSFINININASEMTDDEMIAAIQEQLTMQGLNPTLVTVSHPTPESLEFGFEFGEFSDDGTQKEIHMQIINDEGEGGVEHVQANMLHLDPSETEGKSVEEIRELILQKYQEAGLTIPENLEINNQDGQIEIRIESEDCQ